MRRTFALFSIVTCTVLVSACSSDSSNTSGSSSSRKLSATEPPAVGTDLPLDETSEWTTYANAKYGYTVTYPSAWKVQELDVQKTMIGVNKGATEPGWILIAMREAAAIADVTKDIQQGGGMSCDAPESSTINTLRATSLECFLHEVPVRIQVVQLGGNVAVVQHLEFERNGEKWNRAFRRIAQSFAAKQ